MKEKFEPGPYKFMRPIKQSNFGWYKTAITTENSKVTIATMGGTEEFINAHAPLLTEAPALYGALKTLIMLVPEPQLVSMGFDSPPEHATQEDHELGFALHIGRIVLAKARGEQNV